MVWLSVLGCGDDDAGEGPGPHDAGAAGAEDGSSGSGAGGTGGAPSEPSGGAGGDPATPEAGEGGRLMGASGEAGAPALRDVRGRVSSRAVPAANVVVVIGDQSTLTDEDGTFSFPAVPEQYQLIVIDEYFGLVEVHDEVTTREPVVELAGPVPVSPRAASVAGTLSGAGIPLPKGHEGSVTFMVNDGPYGTQVALETAASTYTLPVSWEGAATVNGELQALTWQSDAFAPTEFTGYARAALELSDGETLGDVKGSLVATQLTLSDPEEVEADVRVQEVPGITLTATTLGVGSIGIPLSLTPGEHTLTVPTVDVPVGLYASFQGDGGQSSSLVYWRRPASSDWELNVVAPPRQVLPINNAQGVTIATEFSVTDVPPRSVQAFVWATGEWLITRVTTSRVTNLPDLTAQGIVYDDSFLELASWRVEVLGPAESVDDYQRREHAYGRRDASESYWLASTRWRLFELAE